MGVWEERIFWRRWQGWSPGKEKRIASCGLTRSSIIPLRLLERLDRPVRSGKARGSTREQQNAAGTPEEPERGGVGILVGRGHTQAGRGARAEAGKGGGAAKPAGCPLNLGIGDQPGWV